MNVGFIGLGNMGSAMARNLIKAGCSVTVYNRTRSRAEELGRDGATVADSPAEAAISGDVLITMLADDVAVEEIVFDPGCALRALRTGSVHVSMSTISVDLSRRLAQVHQQNRQHYVSATVLGRPDAAAAAKLFVLAAGEPGQIRRVQPLLDVLGQKTFVVGEDASAANVIKLASNFMISSVIESLAEAFALVRKHGLDQKAFFDFLTGSLFSAPVYRNYGAMVADDHFEPAGLRLSLGLKDNRLLLSAAEEAEVPMPLANLVHDRFLASLAHGMKEADWSAFAHIAYEEAGLAEAG